MDTMTYVDTTTSAGHMSAHAFTEPPGLPGLCPCQALKTWVALKRTWKVRSKARLHRIFCQASLRLMAHTLSVCRNRFNPPSRCSAFLRRAGTYWTSSPGQAFQSAGSSQQNFRQGSPRCRYRAGSCMAPVKSSLWQLSKSLAPFLQGMVCWINMGFGPEPSLKLQVMSLCAGYTWPM